MRVTLFTTRPSRSHEVIVEVPTIESIDAARIAYGWQFGIPGGFVDSEPASLGLAPCPDARKAICIGHPERNRSVDYEVAARFMFEPPEDEQRSLMRLGYVIYRERCSGCAGTGYLGNSLVKCRRCGGNGEGESLHNAKKNGMTAT